jgi:hypothetical protein
MIRQRREAALLIVLGEIAVIGVKGFGAGTPLRVLAGIALVVVLPGVAAARLTPIRDSDRDGGRLAGAGALAVASVILLGLLLSTGGGIETDGILAGMLIVTAALAVVGTTSESASLRPAISRQTIVAAAMTGAAVAIAVAAFAVARDRALSQVHEESAYAAFLLEQGSGFGVGLTNPTDRPAQFSIRDTANGREATVAVPPHRTRVVPHFLAKPPALRPIEKVLPAKVDPVRIRIAVSSEGRPTGDVLQLSTYAP